MVLLVLGVTKAAELKLGVRLAEPTALVSGNSTGRNKSCPKFCYWGIAVGDYQAKPSSAGCPVRFIACN